MINNVKIENYGPTKNVEIKASLSNIIVFVGKNGSGKTLFLSHILDCLAELKRIVFAKTPEFEENDLLKLGRKNLVSFNEKFSRVAIDIKIGEYSYEYLDLVTNDLSDDVINQISPTNFKNFHKDEFQQNGFFRGISGNTSELKKSFSNFLFSYFPPSRYEHPAWLNKKNCFGFQIDEKFLGISYSSLIKSSIISEIEIWLLDVILDQEIYEKKNLRSFPLPNQATGLIFEGYEGVNSNVRNSINKILTVIYKERYPNLEYARISIAPQNRREIGVIIKEIGMSEVQIAPSFGHLSSGEVMLLSMFGSIIKDAPIKTLNEITGVVLIDEIDLHLHVNLQAKVLPELISLFPKIQFILTTHSPFLLFGLEETFKNGIDVYELPYGNQIETTAFSEAKVCQEKFNDQFSKINEKLIILNQTLTKNQTALIITEGKTDWMHLKSAFSAIIKTNQDYQNLQFELYEFSDSLKMNDSELKNLCKYLSKVAQQRKIICIFDRDVEEIVKEMSGSPSDYKNWGNNVFSFCIPIPTTRQDYSNISIEFFYSDDEIRTIAPDSGKRLLFSNEVLEIVEKNPTTNKNLIKKQFTAPRLEEEYQKKIYCQDVEKILDENGNSIAHSKTIFAEKILNCVPPFDAFSFSEFTMIFATIKKIISLP